MTTLDIILTIFLSCCWMYNIWSSVGVISSKTPGEWNKFDKFISYCVLICTFVMILPFFAGLILRTLNYF